MTNSDLEITATATQAQERSEGREIETQNRYSLPQHATRSREDDEWTSNYKRPSSANTDANMTNFSRNGNVQGNVTSQEFTKQLNYLNMQNNAYLKSDYPDARAYYGWVPGLSSVRFPALIYPQTFFGFAPTVAWMKTNGNDARQAGNIENIDRRDDAIKSTSPKSEASYSKESIDSGYGDNTKYASEKTKVFNAKSINSDDDEGLDLDEDEGLVLDERETHKRRRTSTRCVNSQMAERSSVIQENISVRAKQSVIITYDQDAKDSIEHEHSRPSKRGRASTRQIEKTDQYWDRRKKNNVSAKKSRDARRQREALMNQRSTMLETENLRLRAELATIRDENTRLKHEISSLKSPT